MLGISGVSIAQDGVPSLPSDPNEINVPLNQLVYKYNLTFSDGRIFGSRYEWPALNPSIALKIHGRAHVFSVNSISLTSYPESAGAGFSLISAGDMRVSFSSNGFTRCRTSYALGTAESPYIEMSAGSYTLTSKADADGWARMSCLMFAENVSLAINEIAYKGVKKYKIVKEVRLGTNLQQNDVEVNVAPSKLSSCKAGDSEIKRVKIKLTCKKILANGGEESVEGCKIKNTLNWHNKGPHYHKHSDSTEHIGKLVTNINGTSTDISGELLGIPVSGLELVYVVSVFAGKYSVDFTEAKDPNEQSLSLNSVIVTASIAKSLTPLNNLLIFKALIPVDDESKEESHPNEGYFGTPLLHDRLSIALAQYRTEVIALNNFLEQVVPEALLKQIKIPVIISEAASLSWGGAYDTNRKWSAPHCTHRNGKHIDISMSPFDIGVKNKFLREKYKKILDATLVNKETKLRYGRKEAPNDKKDHWHVQY